MIVRRTRKGNFKITLPRVEARRLNAVLWNTINLSNELYDLSDELDDMLGRPTDEEKAIHQEDPS